MEPADPTVHDANDELRRSLLERCGLLEPGPDPELDRWTAALRRATGSAVAALAVPVGDRTRLTGLWKGDAAQPETADIPVSESLEEFLSAHVNAPAWPDGAHSYLEVPVSVDGHVLCVLAVADAAPRDWDLRDMQILDDAAAAVAAEVRLRLANEQRCPLPRAGRLAAPRARADRRRQPARGGARRAGARNRAPRSFRDRGGGTARSRLQHAASGRGTIASGALHVGDRRCRDRP